MNKPVIARTRRGGGSHRIEEVARIAGVSPITVSRTLNKPDTVTESTRATVWAAIEQTGYVPNRLAGGLASAKSQTVGLVLPHIGNSTFADRVRGMTEVLSAEGYHLLLGLSGYSPEMELQHVLAFLGQRVSGLSLTGATHADRTRALLARAGIPIVETSTVTGEAIDMLVGYSNEAACYAMVEHLARCGYRKIGLISTPQANNDRTAGRRKGFMQAVKDLHLAQDPTLMLEAPAGLATGAKAFVELLSTHPDVEAVFCTNDVLAVGCLLEARRRGIQVPDDIGLAGFDDIELAQEFVPAITTVRVQRYEIGATAARLLLQRIHGETPSQRVVDLGFEIVPRGSTRRPK
jgi:LacI family transcriptional regulator, gluconate utilization system Gnt-I transcriptional repressor